MSKILDLVLAGTPPQFDNDTSLATTEHVQRALGSMAASTAISSATTLTAAHVGRVLQVSSAGPYAVTLPLANSVPDGAAITLVSSASGLITIQRQGTDLIYPNMGTGVQSFTLSTGDTATLVRVNGVWGLVGGSAAMRKSAGDFGAVTDRPGYQRLPSGLIVQWGVTDSISSGVNLAVSLPIAFPTAFLIAHTTVGNLGADIATGRVAIGQIRAGSTTSITIRNLSSEAHQFYWIALGY